MASKTITKHYIPHPDEKDISIVGVLEQLAADQPTKGRGIALVCFRFERSRFMRVADHDGSY
jgi:hypothetical protein